MQLWCVIKNELMEFDMEDLVGWSVPMFLWVSDHITGIFAGILFGLQAVYQCIRIYKQMKECKTKN